MEARDAAAATLNRALALDPLAEEAHRRLIRLHLDRGSYNAAIRRYRQCCEIMRRELGTCPEPSTTALYREALLRLKEEPDTVPDPPTPEAVEGERKQATVLCAAVLPKPGADWLPDPEEIQAAVSTVLGEIARAVAQGVGAWRLAEEW